MISYDVDAGASIALSAATAKTVLGVKSGSAFGMELLGYEFSFDGVTPTNVSVLVEILYSAWTTNPPGTNSTSVTPVQRNGRVISAGFTAGRTWTSEPTGLTVIHSKLFTPDAGFLMHEFVLGQEPDCAVSEGFAMRMTAPNGVNVRPHMYVKRT